ncbi:MAG: nucleoside 2-deoxyribosyltransferase [Bacilli bacterium]|nr:nucleoside 2-deoxyribosyltransferase [Bacilli bacterium]
MKTIYLAGDMLKKGSILLREQEARELRELGHKIYSPIEDKSINDKTNQTEESNNGLAERIVRNDTRGIKNSDIIVIEPHENALGTMVELGQIKGYKDCARRLKSILKYLPHVPQDEQLSYLTDILATVIQRYDKKVYPHLEDIRRTNIPESGDRRSWSVNQYVYGVCLDLTDGKGFYEWNEILEELKEVQ